MHMQLNQKRKVNSKDGLLNDHLHKDTKDKGTPYTFSSAEPLLKDFFDEVNRILKEVAK